MGTMEHLRRALEAVRVTPVTPAQSPVLHANPLIFKGVTPVTAVTPKTEEGGATSHADGPSSDGEALAEAFEERAAIMEFDAGLPRHEAERLARERAQRDGTRPAATAAPAPACRDCAHHGRYGTCTAPTLAGLAERFEIRWPDPTHAVHCRAFAPRLVPDAARLAAAAGGLLGWAVRGCNHE